MTRLGVVVVVLLAACRPTPEAPDGGACFVVEPRTDFDFGEVRSGPFSFATEPFEVRNPTGTTRFITSSPLPSSFTIAPGTSRLAPDARETWSVSFIASDALLHFGEVVLRDDLGCEVPLTLRGLGGGSLSSTPSLDFGFVAPGTEKTLDVVLLNTQRVPVVIDRVDLPSPVFRLADPRPTVVPAASTVTLRVVAAPTAPSISTASLTIASRSTELVTFLSVSAGRPSVEVSPRALHGPRTAPSVFLERSVVVRNNALPGGDGSEVLRLVPPFVSARAFDGGAVAGFSLRPQASLTGGLRGGESGEVVVRFDPPPTLGPAGGMISVFTNDPLQASVEVSFEVEVAPLETCSLAVSPQVLELSAQGDGGSAGSLVFEVLDGGACVVDDVRLISGSAAGVRVVGDAGQLVAPFVVEVAAPTPSTRSRVGAVQFHVLQAGEVVRYVDVHSSP